MEWPEMLVGWDRLISCVDSCYILAFSYPFGTCRERKKVMELIFIWSFSAGQKGFQWWWLHWQASDLKVSTFSLPTTWQFLNTWIKLLQTANKDESSLSWLYAYYLVIWHLTNEEFLGVFNDLGGLLLLSFPLAFDFDLLYVYFIC